MRELYNRFYRGLINLKDLSWEELGLIQVYADEHEKWSLIENEKNYRLTNKICNVK